MVKITAAQVNELRKKTGAGMMDCKKALVEAEGNIDDAIGILRKKGQKIAEKRADRDSSEGAVVSQINDAKTRGVVVSLNCSCEINFWAPSRHRKGCVITIKIFHSDSIFFLTQQKIKKVNKQSNFDTNFNIQRPVEMT